jgi:hypothetical protein
VAEHALERPRAGTVVWTPAREIVAWWVASRAIVLACVATLHWADLPKGYLHHETSSVFGALTAWDGRWYDQIARNGYLLVPGRQSDTAFFPFYPILLRLVSRLGLSYAAAGVVLSNLLLLAGLLVFYRLGRQFLPERDARRATIFAAIAPMGFAFSMVYPESLVFAGLAAAGLAALRGRWLLCAALAAAVTLARPQGALVVIPIAAAAKRAWPTLAPRARGLAAGAIAAPLAALVSVPLYTADILGSPFAWSRAERAWGRSFRWDGFVNAFGQLPARNGTDHWILRDALFCLAYLLLLAVALRAGVPRAWILAGGLMVLLPVETGSFISVARFGLLALPVFWGLAVLGRRSAVDWTLRVTCIALLAFLTLTMPLIFP